MSSKCIVANCKTFSSPRDFQCFIPSSCTLRLSECMKGMYSICRCSVGRPVSKPLSMALLDILKASASVANAVASPRKRFRCIWSNRMTNARHPSFESSQSRILPALASAMVSANRARISSSKAGFFVKILLGSANQNAKTSAGLTPAAAVLVELANATCMCRRRPITSKAGRIVLHCKRPLTEIPATALTTNLCASKPRTGLGDTCCTNRCKRNPPLPNVELCTDVITCTAGWEDTSTDAIQSGLSAMLSLPN
mmetsp:Transcript_32528/g.76435  ORF Transcript_32528/g.76435 Transcript_32528/m.76435 type:complete len:254 (-) Transcript_32528:30-791(-)